MALVLISMELDSVALNEGNDEVTKKRYDKSKRSSAEVEVRRGEHNKLKHNHPQRQRK